MKRTDITSLFPDATEEQVNTLMGINGNDINNAKKGTEELQASLASAQAELETLKSASTESDLQDALKKISELQADIDQRDAADALRELREKVSTETGIPAKLLTGEDEATCKQQAEAIKAFAKPSYPQVRDAGEPHETPALSTREQFAEWLNSQ